MTGRLLGGWVVVRRLVRGARRVESPVVLGELSRLQDATGVQVPLLFLESSEVDVPIVVGCRPVLILPEHLLEQPSLATIEPLLAHELAHVRRRDYLLNMLQSGADAVMFAFPGARWISARVRETREYCCDEVALQVCGDTRRYVEALAGIATLSVARQPVAALGVGGPRLAARIRRFLHGHPEVRHRWARLTALATAAVVAAIACDRVSDLAAAQVAAQVQPINAQAPESGGAFNLTIAYSYEQPRGSSIVIKGFTHGVTFACN